MTTEEKLERFRKICIEDEKARAQRSLDEYKESLLADFEEYKNDALRRQREELSEGREKADREIRSETVKRQLKIRRKAGKRSGELKEELFREVEEKLLEYRKTEGYKNLIKNRIEEIMKAAGEEECEIYFDLTDSDEIKKLAPYNAVLKESRESFLGGLIAVVSSKNLLLDYSFLTRLKEEKNAFSF